MAFGLKYTSTFYQIKPYATEEWLIEIYLEGYGGSSSEIKLDKDSVVMDRGGALLKVVQGTKLSISIINETEGEFKEFREASWGDYKIILHKDPNGVREVAFVGYNQSEIYTEPYDQPPYSSVVEFTDGLRHLDFVRWDDSGTFYDSQKSIIEVLRLALNKLPSPLGIREIVNVYEDNINATTTDSMMNQIYVSSEVYKEIKSEGANDEEAAFFCGKVVEEILKVFGAVIYQWDGYWYIIRPQELNDSTLYYREFNANVGTESTITVDATGSFSSNRRSITGPDGTSTELVLVAPDSEISILEPLNRIQLTYNQNNLDSVESDLIKNGDFSSTTQGTAAAGTYNNFVPNYWTITGADWTTYDAMLYGSWWYTFDPADVLINTTFDSSVYIEQSKPSITTAATDALELSFQAFVKYSDKKDINQTAPANQAILDNDWSSYAANDALLVYEIEIQIGTYYLSGDPDTGYSWVASSSRAKFWQKGGLQQGWSSQGLGNNLYHYYKNVLFNVTLPLLPETGIRTFRFRCYMAYFDFSSFTAVNNSVYRYRELLQLYHKDFRLIYLPSQLPPTEELVVYTEIDEDENVEEIEVIHGDGSNSLTMNSFRLVTGVITDSWSRRGYGETLEIITLFLQSLRDMRGEFKKLNAAKLIGDFDIYNIIRDTYDGTVDYWIKNYKWNVCTNEWSVELSEHITSVVTMSTVTANIVVPTRGDTAATTTTGENNDPAARNSSSPSIVIGNESASKGDTNNLTTFN